MRLKGIKGVGSEYSHDIVAPNCVTPAPTAGDSLIGMSTEDSVDKHVKSHSDIPEVVLE
jgi:hypothetical protein